MPVLPVSCVPTHMSMVLLSAALIFIVSICIPWDSLSSRVGNSTLGIYLWHSVFPFMFCGWIVTLSDMLGQWWTSYQSVLGCIQYFMLVGNAIGFTYLLG